MASIKNILTEVHKAIESKTDLNVNLFLFPFVNNEDYTCTFNSYSVQTNTPDTYTVEGIVFKTVILESVNDIGLFEFAGETIQSDNCNVSFDKEVNFVKEINNQTNTEFTAKCKFHALVKVEKEHDTTRVSQLTVDINNNTIIVATEDSNEANANR